jgi:hypothetical protein
MCEHCRTKRPVKLEPLALAAGERTPFCDECASVIEEVEGSIFEDPDDPDDLTLRTDIQSAAWVLTEAVVEDHFCESHALLNMNIIDSGLGDAYRAAGLQVSEDYLPIEKPEEEREECSYMPPPGLLNPGSLPSCRQLATYAHLAVEEYALCRTHARAYE